MSFKAFADVINATAVFKKIAKTNMFKDPFASQNFKLVL